MQVWLLIRLLQRCPGRMGAEGDPRVGTWLKGVAPSKELREWYNHQPDLCKLTKRRVVTLVTATRDVEGSQAAVLATLLRRR